jgi:hypothetical protein
MLSAKKLKFLYVPTHGVELKKAEAKPIELHRPSNIEALIFLYKPNVILLFKLLTELTFYTYDDKL